MVLLDELIYWAEGEAACTLRVREGTPFVHEGRIEGCATLEHMAQCVAACLGYEALRGGGGVRVGMIIACKRFELFVPHLAVHDEAVVRAKRIRGNDTLSHFECRLERGDELVATAVLTLFHGERPPE
jgi:predicted hotdog family 3-hydroxylacyl-ACP dehydratase